MATWLTSSLRPLVEEALLNRRDLLGLPVSQGAITRMYAQLLAGDGSKAWGLWLLLSLVLWERSTFAKAIR